MTGTQAMLALLCLVALLPATTLAAEEQGEKRDLAGLFPFPRVGRAQYPTTWPSFDQWKMEVLTPFYRVGRSGGKRNGASANGGLWFGPRLGKRTPFYYFPTGVQPPVPGYDQIEEEANGIIYPQYAK